MRSYRSLKGSSMEPFFVQKGKRKRMNGAPTSLIFCFHFQKFWVYLAYRAHSLVHRWFHLVQRCSTTFFSYLMHNTQGFMHNHITSERGCQNNTSCISLITSHICQITSVRDNLNKIMVLGTQTKLEGFEPNLISLTTF